MHWDWELETHLPAGVAFPAEAYDAEVARIGAGRSWERPEDTSARLVPTPVDHARLGRQEFRVEWVARDHADDSQLMIGLAVAGEPATWPATWHGSSALSSGLPRIAGPGPTVAGAGGRGKSVGLA